MEIRHFIYNSVIAGSLLAFLLLGCAPDPRTLPKVSSLSGTVSSNAITPHPVKTQAKAPPPRKKLFFFEPEYDDVWERVRGDFRLDHDASNPRVQAHIRWFQKHPDYVERVINRASPYLYLIVEELDRRNMPKEIALLPVIESAFNPLAYSPAHASGLWQMIPGTAKHYGIQINNYYDGRQDIYAATNSALDFLTKLSNDFNGDWLLVLAAYNTGEGNVKKALDKNRRLNKSMSFWELKVHSETYDYVPRLLALCHIIKNAEKYNLTLPNIANKPHVQMINVGRQIDLDLAAQLAGMSLFELKQYNPGYKSWATSPNGPYHLLLPMESAEKFTTNFASLPPDHSLGITDKKLMLLADNSKNAGAGLGNKNKGKNKGKTTSKSTSSSKTGSSGKSASNNKPSTSNKTAANKTGSSPKAAPNKSAAAPKTTSHKNEKVISYSVKKGDTVSKIAKQFGVSQKDLLHWNGSALSKTLHIGQKVKVVAK